jgi:cytochrome d ubiquinol oxidase subunit I
MDVDVVLLSRIQFAANISFHILFPTITIGLAWLLLYFRCRFSITQDKAWEYAYQFWVKIFALTFALGVVSGITMSFQFGTNWPGFMERAGNIAGPLLGYEVLTAFFLEASFLGIMLFGRDRVSNRVHLLACAIVAIGTCFSAFWILALNSWMQTPTGHILVDGVFYAESWWDIIFNPSFPFRFAHMMNASLITAAFLIMGISAWRMRSGVDGPATWKVMKTGIIMATVLTPLQVFIGDLHGLNTLEHQPAKVAAMEGLWETEKGAALTLFGILDEEERTTHYAIKIPKLASLVLTHELDGQLVGLNDFEDHPPVAPVFWAFRVMVGVGGLMVLVSFWAAYQVYRYDKPGPLLLMSLSGMTFSGWVAVLAGWYVSEIGRQPFLVYGLLRVEDAVADHPSGMVLSTLIAYLVLYAFLLIAYISTLRYLATKPAKSLVLLHEYNAPLTQEAT